MPGPSRKFDPARAHHLDAPEREAHLPTAELVGLLALRGGERVVDYGAGTGRLALAAAEALGDGEVVAVEESEEMFALLSERVATHQRISPLLIRDNAVPLDAGSVDRVIAVNLLHEIRGESALREMRRLLAPGGLALVVDWERGRARAGGPPDELLYSADEAASELAAAGFAVVRPPVELPWHFVLQARPAD